MRFRNVTNIPTHAPMTTGFTPVVGSDRYSGRSNPAASNSSSGGYPSSIRIASGFCNTAGSTVTGGRWSPTTVTTTVAASPASGPATPISNSAFRSGIRPFILMTAPIVPMSVGTGMK
jgi:hypothetical protein